MYWIAPFAAKIVPESAGGTADDDLLLKRIFQICCDTIQDKFGRLQSEQVIVRMRLRTSSLSTAEKNRDF
jgi:hypothetical protein